MKLATSRLGLAAVLFVALAVTATAAGPMTITIKDWTGRGFAADLVTCTIDAPADGGKPLRLLDADGKSLPVQATTGQKGQATRSFVASIAPNGIAICTLRSDGEGPAAYPVPLPVQSRFFCGPPVGLRAAQHRPYHVFA